MGGRKMLVKQVIRQFVVETFLFGNDDGLENDTSFLENGVIDSTGMLELIMFLENKYGIRIADEELVPENLDSVQNIAGFIERKTGQRILKAS